MALMLSAALRLLTLLGLLLMPLGMAAAPASPLPQAAMDMAGHCPDSEPASKAHAGFGECTMACSAALPAVQAMTAKEHPAAMAVVHPIAIVPLTGIELEIATPPPRLG